MGQVAVIEKKFRYTLNGVTLFQSDDPIKFYYFLLLNPELAKTVLLNCVPKLESFRVDECNEEKIAVEIN